MLRGQTHQESISSILRSPRTLSTPFFKARQALHFLKQAKNTILWSMPRTPLYEARQAWHFYEICQAHKHTKSIEHASTLVTRARKARKHAIKQTRKNND